MRWHTKGDFGLAESIALTIIFILAITTLFVLEPFNNKENTEEKKTVLEEQGYIAESLINKPLNANSKTELKNIQYEFPEDIGDLLTIIAEEENKTKKATEKKILKEEIISFVKNELLVFGSEEVYITKLKIKVNKEKAVDFDTNQNPTNYPGACGPKTCINNKEFTVLLKLPSFKRLNTVEMEMLIWTPNKDLTRI